MNWKSTIKRALDPPQRRPEKPSRRLPCDLPTGTNGPCITPTKPRQSGAIVHYTRRLDGKPCQAENRCVPGVTPGPDLRPKCRKKR